MPALRAALALLIICLCLPAFGQTYDVVIRGGRVLDPETGLDAVRDVGISGGQDRPLSGKRTIEARGLVVAPGFIDLHQHGQDPDSQRLKALDGVTTALELEIGAPDVTAFLEAHQGKSLINYTLSASHAAARAAASAPRCLETRSFRNLGRQPTIPLPLNNSRRLNRASSTKSRPAHWALGWAFSTRPAQRGSEVIHYV